MSVVTAKRAVGLIGKENVGKTRLAAALAKSLLARRQWETQPNKWLAWQSPEPRGMPSAFTIPDKALQKGA